MTCLELFNFVTNHKAVEVLMFTAGIKTMPSTWSDTWYETLYYWIYDGAHQFFNITNNRLAKETVPTPPVTKEELVTHPKAEEK